MRHSAFDASYRSAALAGSALLLLACAPGHAQEIAGTGSGSQLDEIVVTAQKRAQNLQRVPIALTAISGDKLAAAAITTTIDLAAVTPGLNMVGSIGFVKPFIRGVGNNAQGTGIETAVSIYVDGVYFASSPASLFTFTDVERVEVLKGPQGTLFGRNAIGGLIQIITKTPSQELTGEFTAGYGNYDTLTLNGYVSTGLAPNVAVSLAAQYSEQGKGFGTNFLTGEDVNIVNHDFSIRGKVLVDIGPDTQLTISGDYVDRDAPLFAFRPVPGFTPRFQSPAFIANGSPWDVNNNAPAPSALEGGGGSANFTHDFGSVTLTSITAYRDSTFRYGNDNDGSPLPLVQLDINLNDTQFTQELQLQAATGSAVQWTIGGFYLSASSQADPFRVLNGGFTAPTPTSVAVRTSLLDFGTRSLAAFAQATAEVLPRTNLTLGLRYTVEERDADYTTSGLLNNGTTQLLVAPRRDEINYRRLTWRAALDHSFTDDVLGYLSYNRGFKAGGFNPANLADPPYLPETLDAFEIGLKTELLDRRLRFNIAGFYYDYSNVQVFRLVSGLQSISNGAQAEMYGVDVDVDAIITDNLSISGGAEWLKSRFVSFPNGTLATPLPTGAFSQLPADLSGNRTPNSPAFTGNLAFDLHGDTGIGGLSLNVNAAYNSGFFGEADNTLRQSSFVLLNTTAQWTAKNERLFVRLYGKNLLNEVITTQLFAGALNGLASFQAPRTYGATLGVKF